MRVSVERHFSLALVKDAFSKVLNLRKDGSIAFLNLIGLGRLIIRNLNFEIVNPS